MKKIDPYSYALGVIDCFNEMIHAGVKKIALSHPMDTKEKRDELLPATEEICQRYGTTFYLEDELLTTDLFPKSMTTDCFLMLFYQDPKVIENYLALKERKASLIAEQRYIAPLRVELAMAFGQLLGYDEEKTRQMIANNQDKEN